MAKIPFGILGAFIGAAGPVIGKTWKNKAVMTAARHPAKTDKHPTETQAKQRSKFGIISQFLHGLGPVVKTTFHEQAIGKTEFQCAVSYNMCNAVGTSGNGFTILYDRVSVGRGTLPNAVLPEAKAGESAGEVHYLWADNTGMGTAMANDKAVPVLYMPDNGQWASLESWASRRSDGAITFVSPGLSGRIVHTWLTFVSDSGKSADSIYTGELTVK